MQTFEQRVVVLEAKTNAGIKAAVDSNNDVDLNQLVRQRGELKSLRDDWNSLLQRLHRIEAGSGVAGSNGFEGRTVSIIVTQGMINQNLLTLTDAVKHREVKVGEKFIIRALPSGHEFQTELISGGNRLRERSYIGRFYRDAAVTENDVVELNEIKPGFWQLRKTDKKFQLIV